MTKIEAVVRPAKLDDIQDALRELGVDGMTVTEVRGNGRLHPQVFRAAECTFALLPKFKIEIVLEDASVDSVVKAIVTSAATGKVGDGKVFLSKVNHALRIRNSQLDVAAL